jgi:hypothetical protein
MELLPYFVTNDGSLPEIEVTFSDPAASTRAFHELFRLGADDVTHDGGKIWVLDGEYERSFEGPTDADLVVLGKVQPFHVVLGGVKLAAVNLPELGVFFGINGLTIDYRMGPEWSALHIAAFVMLLRTFKDLGATISAPWWGSSAEHLFNEVINAV